MSTFAAPLSRLERPLEAVRQFTPNWFTVTMGTGITALMLGQLAQTVPIVKPLAVALWLANMPLFAVFAAMFVGRIILFPQTIRPLFLHPAQSMFVGAIPMGLATIVNGLVAFGAPYLGEAVYRCAEWLWGADVVLAVISGLLIPYLMWAMQEHALEQMTALWLLPVVPAEVAAASAGLIAPHVATADQQTLVIGGILLWAFSVPVALAILSILFLRLAIHKQPPKDLGVSGWLTLGPLGTGAFASVLLGLAVKGAVTGTPLEPIAAAAQAIGIGGGLILWAYGLWWWILSIAATLAHCGRGLPFNMGWWAFTFPLGVYTASTYALAGALSAPVFSMLAIALTIVLALLWLVVLIRTIAGAYTGGLFHAPCLQQRPQRP